MRRSGAAIFDASQPRRALAVVVARRARRRPRHEICHRALHERFFPPADYFGHRRSGSQSESGHRVRRVFRIRVRHGLRRFCWLSSAAMMALLVWLLLTGRAGGCACAERARADSGRRGRQCARPPDPRRRNRFPGSPAGNVSLARIQRGRFGHLHRRGAGAHRVALWRARTGSIPPATNAADREGFGRHRLQPVRFSIGENQRAQAEACATLHAGKPTSQQKLTAASGDAGRRLDLFRRASASRR